MNANKKSRRSSFLKETLHEIRAKRLSMDAPAKGLFPARTPSIPILSTRGSTTDKEPEKVVKGPPILSLTKLDFEFLREWDWKERKQRLETWKNDLGLGLAKAQELYKTQDSHKSSFQQQQQQRKSMYAKGKPEEDAATRKEKLSKLKFGTAGLTLKRDLDQLTGIKVNPPEIQSRRKRMDNSKSFAGGSAVGTQKRSISNSITSETRKTFRHTQNKLIHQKQLETKDLALDRLVDKAREMETKSTFGRGWGKKKDVSAAPVPPPTETGAIHKQDHHQQHHHHHHQQPTDVEEEQPPTTSYVSHPSHLTTDVSRLPSSASSSSDGIGISALFKSIHETNADKDEEEDSSEEGSQKAKSPPKYTRPRPPPEFQDTCFGSIKFVDKTALKPRTQPKQQQQGKKRSVGDREYYMTFDDPDFALALGNTQHIKVRFFKGESSGTGRSNRILAREKNYRDLLAKQEEMKRLRELEEKQEMEKIEAKRNKAIIKSFSELPTALQLTAEDKQKYAEKLAEFEKAILQIPGIGSTYRIEVEPVSRDPSVEIPADAAAHKVPRRNQYTRPPKRVWYTPLPLTVKKYYRTNWKKIRFDVRKEMRDKNFWPKLWINFEETHPKKMFELIQAKLAVKQFDQYGYQKEFDWGKGVHPDYIDWILEDIVPHPGQYFYDDETQQEPVRRGSYEETDFPIKNWFMKPPRYIPATPPSPPFDQFDFCGYGNRENSYFLDFTLPREILHYYAPPSKIEQFFRQIPKPPYAFPGYTFKRWLKYPLEQKLPQYTPFPKRFTIWTRGKVGDSIKIRSTNFKLDDPLSLKVDLNYNPYHDPHTRKYFLKKNILDRLWELGIINSKGEVKCTMKEFNQNRRYLRDYEWLDECLRRWSMKWVSRLEHNRLTKETNITNLDWDSKTRIWHERLDRCQAYRKIRDEEEEMEIKEREKRYEAALQNIIEVKQNIRMEMIARGKVKRKEQKARKKTLFGLQRGRILLLQTIYNQRHKRAVRNRRSYHRAKMLEEAEKESSFQNRHMEFARRRMEEMEELKRKLEEERHFNVEMHKQRMKEAWEDVPFGILRRKERLRTEWMRRRKLASKYFRIWLKKTRESKKLYASGEHGSVWANRHLMRKLVKDLRAQSHYIKVEDIVYQVVMQRRLMKEINKSSFEEGYQGRRGTGRRSKYNKRRSSYSRERGRGRKSRESDYSSDKFHADDEDSVEGEKLYTNKKNYRPDTAAGYDGDIDGEN